MSIKRYCWRCKTEIPMLEEHEWEIIDPLLRLDISRIQSYRQDTGCSLSIAMVEVKSHACLEYGRITGYIETNFNLIWHHRNSAWGPDCAVCKKPYKTPQARYCCECGHGMDLLGKVN